MAGEHPDSAVAHDAAWSRALLKRGRFGTVSRLALSKGGETAAWLVERDTRTAAWGLRLVARRLAAREARILALLARVPDLPKLADWDGRCLRRSWLPGEPLATQTLDRSYFREALRIVRRMHGVGIVHNDLARTKNWLVTSEGRPALIGLDRARRVRYRGRRFRALACSDLRDLLEHKRACCGALLTSREQVFLARRGSWFERLWLRVGKWGHS
jgi:predicted Ser/Thr protein kinase